MTFDTFYLAGSILLLVAVTWSMKKPDFARGKPVWPSAAIAGSCGALFTLHLTRLLANFGGWPEDRLLTVTVTVASLSAATILMGLRTYRIWREGRAEPDS